MWGDGIELLCAPRIDALTIRLGGVPESFGFTIDERGCWRRGAWRAAECRDRNGFPWTRATVEASALAQDSGVYLEDFDDGEVMRIDICVDVTGAPVTPELVEYFAGHRGSTGHISSGGRTTVYIGSRRSPVMLRVYDKASESNPAPKWLEETWAEQPRSSVTRVEFELKRGAVDGLTMGALRKSRARIVAEKWKDAVARVTLKSSRTDNYKERNKAPTSPGWRALGEPERIKRAAVKRGPMSVVTGAERMLARRLARAARAGLDVNRLVEIAKWIELTEAEEKAARRIETARRKADLIVWIAEGDSLPSEKGDSE